MKILTASILLAISVGAGACARFQPVTPAVQPQDYTPAALTQSLTLKNTSVTYDPAVLKVGTARTRVREAFGDPNASETADTGQLEDVYAFNPDGTKFADPKIRPRNIALAVLTMGTSVAVRQARLALAERKLTLYHVYYASDGTIASVQEEKMSDAANTPAASATPGDGGYQ